MLDRVIAVRNAKTIYRDGDRCIKVFNRDYSTSDILNEAHNHALMMEAGLHVPELKEVTMIDGKWAIVTRYIKGKTLSNLIAESRSGYEEYLDQFVSLQLDIQSYRCSKLKRLHDKMHMKIDQTDFDPEVKARLHDHLSAMPDHNKVCHGDYNPSNVIISEDGHPYILDWSHVTQGNASADVARTYLLFGLAGRTEMAEKYLHLFCSKSDTAIEYVRSWMPIVAASQSVKGNLREREYLMSWVKEFSNN